MIEFFSAIVPGELGSSRFLELRTIQNGTVNSDFFSSLELAAAFAFAEAAAGKDVYFGVVPRKKMSGKAEDCEQFVSVLWADYDAKVFDDSKVKAFFALTSVTPQPQIVVDSGHGFHAYWLLSDPVGYPTALDAMKGISIVTGSDHCYDLPRILRVPGTVNFKNGRTAPVRLLRFDTLGRKHDISLFVDYIEKGRYVPRRAPLPVTANPVELDHFPNWLQELILVGVPAGKDRSSQCYRVVLKLLENGWTEDRIEALFKANPIGEKYREKGKDGHRWLMLSVKRAREWMQSQPQTW